VANVSENPEKPDGCEQEMKIYGELNNKRQL